MNIEYGKDYFETVATQPGLNKLVHNPFKVIDFSLLVLKAGESHEFSTANREYGLDITSGLADVKVDSHVFKSCGGRASVFSGKPTLVYAGCESTVTITALTDLEVGLGSALSSTPTAPYIIGPDQVRSGQWGLGNTTRYFDFLLDGKSPGERLFFAEVTVHNGNWATYPPHKHEEGEEGECFQEELYFYKVQPERGMGFCGQFGGQMKEDFAFPITNNTIHKQPHGYHTVTAAPGYSICYLAVFAGHGKSQKVALHPDHAWYMNDFERTLALTKK